MSDWFSRDETPRTTVLKKPNPLNIQNKEKIGELEERIKRYGHKMIKFGFTNLSID
jgi:hypothetical protein